MTSQFIGEYRVLRKLGAGGMASVYLAAHRDVPNLRTVLKELSDSQLVDRFRREADKLALLDGHSGICQIKHFFEDNGRFYIVMEYIEGPTLDDLIRSEHPPDVADSLEFVRSILATLDFAHQQGIIHRDIKPTNVMIDRNGNVKVIDFGIAKGATDPDLTQVGSSLGSPRYMAPEQFGSDRDVDWVRCDIYAVGVTLYHLLTHDFPFQGADIFEMREAKLTQDPAPPSQLNPAIPPELDAIVLKAISREPRDRYASAAAMRAALSMECATTAVADRPRRDVTEVFSAGLAKEHERRVPARAEAETPPRAPVSQPKRQPAAVRPWYRRRSVAVASALLVAIIAIGSVVALRPDSPSLPPVLDAPKADAVLVDPLVCFRWHGGGGESPYELELATDPAFTAPRTFNVIAADSLRLDAPLGDGVHYWRVRPDAPIGKPTRPWSSTGLFRIAVPAKAVAYLTVIIRPKGELQVDGIMIGWETTKKLTMVPDVPHVILVSNPESLEKQKSEVMTLKPDENREILFDLGVPKPRPLPVTAAATVQVRIGAQVNKESVTKASVSIDGRLIDDETTCTLSLPVGQHKIVVTRTIDGVVWEGSDTVTLSAGMARQDIQIEMRPGR